MVNFKSKLSSASVPLRSNPIEIYDSLDRSTVAGPLRSIQESILTQWFNDRNDEKDLIVKLHTGEGKTLIGLLILYSKLNQQNKPGLFICPNKYLVEQVKKEAVKFGIPVCSFDDGNNEFPDGFTESKKNTYYSCSKGFQWKNYFWS